MKILAETLQNGQFCLPPPLRFLSFSLPIQKNQRNRSKSRIQKEIDVFFKDAKNASEKRSSDPRGERVFLRFANGGDGKAINSEKITQKRGKYI